MKKQYHNVCLHFQGDIEIINIIKILLKSSWVKIEYYYIVLVNKSNINNL